jgi:hypothetical protein
VSPLGGTNAGFRYTSGSQARVIRLAFPMKLEMAPARTTRRYASDSLDLSAREVISIASGRNEVEATLRFNRNARDLLEMLRHAADGTVVTYYPDLAVNTGYALWLVSEGDTINLNPDAARYGYGEYQKRVRFRDASASGTSLEALFSPWLFRFDGGSFPEGAVFTRTGDGATAVGQFGTLESYDANEMRTSWPLVNGVRVPAYLGEEARTNLFTRSGDLTHGDWTVSSLSAQVADQALGPDGLAGMDRLVEDGTTAWHGVSQTKTVTDGALMGLSVWAIPETRTRLALALRDAGGTVTDWSRARFDLSTGTVISTGQGGNGTTAMAWVEDWTHIFPGLRRYLMLGSVTGTTNLRGQIHMMGDTSESYAGDGASSILAGYAQYELGYPSSYIPTTTEAVARGSDRMEVPYGAAPQAAARYTRFVELGATPWPFAGGANPRIVQIGATNNTNPRWAQYKANGTTEYRALVRNPATTGSDTVVAINLAPARGDLIELMDVLYSDGSIQLFGRKTVGGVAGPIVSSARSAAFGLPSQWSAQVASIGVIGATGQGDLALLAAKVAAGSGHSLDAMRRL